MSLFTKSLDSILSDLSKPLKQLEELQTAHTQTIADQNEKIAKLQADNAAKQAEVTRAAQVHSNISTLLAVPATPSSN